MFVVLRANVVKMFLTFSTIIHEYNFVSVHRWCSISSTFELNIYVLSSFQKKLMCTRGKQVRFKLSVNHNSIDPLTSKYWHFGKCLRDLGKLRRCRRARSTDSGIRGQEAREGLRTASSKTERPPQLCTRSGLNKAEWEKKNFWRRKIHINWNRSTIPLISKWDKRTCKYM